MTARRGARRDWAAVRPCGTNAAYQRHKRHGEQPCEPCKRARARYNQDWERARRKTPS